MRLMNRLMFVLAIAAGTLSAADTWPGFQDQSTPLNTPSFTFTGTVPEMWSANNNYYDGDFADFDGDGKMDRLLGSRFGLLRNKGGGVGIRRRRDGLGGCR